MCIILQQFFSKLIVYKPGTVCYVLKKNWIRKLRHKCLFRLLEACFRTEYLNTSCSWDSWSCVKICYFIAVFWISFGRKLLDVFCSEKVFWCRSLFVLDWSWFSIHWGILSSFMAELYTCWFSLKLLSIKSQLAFVSFIHSFDKSGDWNCSGWCKEYLQLLARKLS